MHPVDCTAGAGERLDAAQRCVNSLEGRPAGRGWTRCRLDHAAEIMQSVVDGRMARYGLTGPSSLAAPNGVRETAAITPRYARRNRAWTRSSRRHQPGSCSEGCSKPPCLANPLMASASRVCRGGIAAASKAPAS